MAELITYYNNEGWEKQFILSSLSQSYKKITRIKGYILITEYDRLRRIMKFIIRHPLKDKSHLVKCIRMYAQYKEVFVCDAYISQYIIPYLLKTQENG